MKLDGSFVVPLWRGAVWEMLNSPEVLQRAIPGCKSLESTEDGYVATVAVALGPVKATFAGTVTLIDVNPGVGLTLVGQGTGGVAGFAKGTARMRLEDHPDGTAVVYDTDVVIGGKLIQLGSRLIEATSKKLTIRFFDEISRIAVERSSAA